LSKPLKIQIVERARALIANEEHWCRGDLARDANGVGVCPTSDSATSALPDNHDRRAAHDLAIKVMRPLRGSADRFSFLFSYY
jgi:hypothetical protein